MTFDKAFKAAEPFMVIDQDRAKSIYDSAQATAKLPGAVAELGVYRGGSAMLMSMAAEPKKIFLFDTFEGLPAPLPIDVHRKGEFACPEGYVRQAMNGRRFELVKGRFPESVPADFSERFSLVHIDGDLYETTRDGLEFVWERLDVGGRIVLDDWRWKNCPGVLKAVLEFFERLGAEGWTSGEAKGWESAQWQFTIEKLKD